MATVYLAADLKHDRKVAIKVLKPELAAVLGAERFVVEIKTTAALSHPHILPLFDSGEAAGFLFYVMPYIEGETIREKLNRETQFGIEEALKITAEVADALDYAHRHGVIHRDIKPENILLHDGRPMVMDFGIALAVSAAAGGRMTETGLSLGTPHYMSPEQATADKQITARSDIYSLASVLYEMLAGEPPHTGGSAQAIIMKIIAERPQPVTELRRSVPPNVAAALAKALEKVPADRFDSAKAFGDALGNAAFTTITHAALAGAGSPRGVRRWAPVALAAAAAALLTGIGFTLSREEPARQVARFTLELPSHQRLDGRAVDDAPFAISPDGSTIVYVATDSASGRSGLHVRALDRLKGTLLSSVSDPTSPFFSPDGQWVGFFADGGNKLMKVAITGGPALTLATDVRRSLATGHWSEDDWIYYVSVPGTQISRVRGSGGASERLVPGDTIGGSAFPFVLPGGKALLVGHCQTSACPEVALAWLDLATREHKVLLPRADRGWYSPTGHLIYSTPEGAVFAVAFDPANGEMSGTPIPLLEEVRRTGDGGTRFAFSPSGTMIYLPGLLAGGVELVEVDRAGRETVLIAEPGNYFSPRWSPTRDRVALQVRVSGDTSQIWVYDVGARTMTRLTHGDDDVRPSWSPDGRRVVFVSARSNRWGLYWMPADGSAPAELVAPGEETGGSTSWTRDGAWILFDGVFGTPTEDVFAIGTRADRSRRVVVSTPGTDESGVVSPDGRWVAYVSDESGRSQVYVRPFLRPGGRWLISPGLAFAPLWASNSELTYVDPDAQRLVSVQLSFSPDPRPTSRTALLDWSRYRTGSRSVAQHDISWDGQRFLVLRQPGRGNHPTSPIVVLNWFEEIRRSTARGEAGR